MLSQVKNVYKLYNHGIVRGSVGHNVTMEYKRNYSIKKHQLERNRIMQEKQEAIQSKIVGDSLKDIYDPTRFRKTFRELYGVKNEKKKTKVKPVTKKKTTFELPSIFEILKVPEDESYTEGDRRLLESIERDQIHEIERKLSKILGRTNSQLSESDLRVIRSIPIEDLKEMFDPDEVDHNLLVKLHNTSPNDRVRVEGTLEEDEIIYKTYIETKNGPKSNQIHLDIEDEEDPYEEQDKNEAIEQGIPYSNQVDLAPDMPLVRPKKKPFQEFTKYGLFNPNNIFAEGLIDLFRDPEAYIKAYTEKYNIQYEDYMRNLVKDLSKEEYYPVISLLAIQMNTIATSTSPLEADSKDNLKSDEPQVKWSDIDIKSDVKDDVEDKIFSTVEGCISSLNSFAKLMRTIERGNPDANITTRDLFFYKSIKRSLSSYYRALEKKGIYYSEAQKSKNLSQEIKKFNDTLAKRQEELQAKTPSEFIPQLIDKSFVDSLKQELKEDGKFKPLSNEDQLLALKDLKQILRSQKKPMSKLETNPFGKFVDPTPILTFFNSLGTPALARRRLSKLIRALVRLNGIPTASSLLTSEEKDILSRRWPNTFMSEFELYDETANINPRSVYGEVFDSMNDFNNLENDSEEALASRLIAEDDKEQEVIDKDKDKSLEEDERQSLYYDDTLFYADAEVNENGELREEVEGGGEEGEEGGEGGGEGGEYDDDFQHEEIPEKKEVLTLRYDEDGEIMYEKEQDLETESREDIDYQGVVLGGFYTSGVPGLARAHFEELLKVANQLKSKNEFSHLDKLINLNEPFTYQNQKDYFIAKEKELIRIVKEKVSDPKKRKSIIAEYRSHIKNDLDPEAPIFIESTEQMIDFDPYEEKTIEQDNQIEDLGDSNLLDEVVNSRVLLQQPVIPETDLQERFLGHFEHIYPDLFNQNELLTYSVESLTLANLLGEEKSFVCQEPYYEAQETFLSHLETYFEDVKHDIDEDEQLDAKGNQAMHADEIPLNSKQFDNYLNHIRDFNEEEDENAELNPLGEEEEVEEAEEEEEGEEEGEEGEELKEDEDDGSYDLQIVTDNYFEDVAVLKVGIHTKVTKAGRINSFSCLVFCSNENGTGAIGYGKGDSAAIGLRRAMNDANRNSFTLDLYKGNTLPSGFRIKHRSTQLNFYKTQRPDQMNTRSWKQRAILPMLGIYGTGFRIFGRQDWRSLLETIRHELPKFTNPEEAARLMGKRYVNAENLYKHMRNPDLKPLSKLIQDKLDNQVHQTHYDVDILSQFRYDLEKKPRKVPQEVINREELAAVYEKYYGKEDRLHNKNKLNGVDMVGDQLDNHSQKRVTPMYTGATKRKYERMTREVK